MLMQETEARVVSYAKSLRSEHGEMVNKVFTVRFDHLSNQTCKNGYCLR